MITEISSGGSNPANPKIRIIPVQTTVETETVLVAFTGHGLRTGWVV